MQGTEAASPKPALNATATSTTIDTEKQAGTRRRRSANKGEDNFIFCLDASKGEAGVISLSKPGQKKEIIAQAYKTGVHYFRLQKFKTEFAESEDGKFEIVETPVE
jgi:hypothetical protein